MPTDPRNPEAIEAIRVHFSLRERIDALAEALYVAGIRSGDKDGRPRLIAEGVYTNLVKVQRVGLERISDSSARVQELDTLRQQLAEKGWRCFHCAETFTNEAEALEHFGRDEDKAPACQLGSESVKRIRELEEEIAEVRAENTVLENDARLWHEHDADRVRRIGNRQWWQEIDYREGEKIALTARAEAAEAKLAEAEAERDKWRACVIGPAADCADALMALQAKHEALTSALSALVEKWRLAAFTFTMSAEAKDAIDGCADDLAALLAKGA